MSARTIVLAALVLLAAACGSDLPAVTFDIDAEGTAGNVLKLEPGCGDFRVDELEEAPDLVSIRLIGKARLEDCGSAVFVELDRPARERPVLDLTSGTVWTFDESTGDWEHTNAAGSTD